MNWYISKSFKFISPYREWYDENKKVYNTWGKIYDVLDVSCLKDYSAFVVIANAWFKGFSREDPAFKRHIYRAPKQLGFVSYKSIGQFMTNIVAIAKAARKYRIPVYEVAFDPNEVTYELWNPDYRPPIHHLYHGYDTFLGHQRLDTYQYYFKHHYKKFPEEKDLDFVFACTATKGTNREQELEIMEQFLQEHPDIRNPKIFLKSEIDKSWNPMYSGPIHQDTYFSLLNRATYSWMFPAGNVKCFSIYRFLECLACDCLPILSPNVDTKEVSKSFGYDIEFLKSPIPKSDVPEVLGKLKSVFLEPKKLVRFD